MDEERMDDGCNGDDGCGGLRMNGWKKGWMIDEERVKDEERMDD